MVGTLCLNEAIRRCNPRIRFTMTAFPFSLKSPLELPRTCSIFWHSMLDPLRILISLVLVSSAAFGDVLLSDGFETDPLVSGWTRSGSGAEWTTTESAADSHSLKADTDAWSSPLLDTQPLRWYRLSFKSKAP